jgi:putative transposase
VITLLHQTYPALSVRTLCHWLGVSRSWYYAHPITDGRAEADIALRDAIERIVLDFPGYGYRRVTHALRRAGWGPLNRKRVLRVMREESLLCQLKRCFVVTTDSAHGYRTYPNLLKRVTLDRLDQAWVTDLTYIRLPTAFAYLACILDAFSRRCISWKPSRQIDTRLTLAALEMAIQQRNPQPGLIHHSDRGVQYASRDYVSRLEEIEARVSMSATGNPYDNAKAESFFKTLKREEVSLKDYRTFADAEANLGPFIEDVYNTKRLHSSLGYLPPAEFEATYTTQSMLELPLPLVR